MQTISRSKTIFVPITKIGRNYLPFVKELESHNVKYIDIVASAIDYQGDNNIIQTKDADLYLSLADKYGNIFYDNIDIRNFAPGYYLGQRKLIGKKLILQNCFLDCAKQYLVGRVVAITFYWDEDSYCAHAKDGSLAKCYKETVELFIQPSLSREKKVKIKFPDIRTIAGKRIRAIRPAYNYSTISPLGYTTILSGWNVANSQSYYSIYLTLANGSVILIDRLDMVSLNDSSLLDALSFNDILVNFPDSYIEVVMKYGEGDTLPADIRSIPLIIEYLED